MKKLSLLVISLSLVVSLSSVSYAAVCTPVDTISKGALTAYMVAVNGETITGDVDAHGCDIGVFVPQGVTNVSVNAEVHDSNQYGVLNEGNVTISDSEIYNIGTHDGLGAFAPNGVQTGVGVYFGFGSEASGEVKDSSVHHYQKGGIVVNGEGTTANVTNNLVTGLGAVNFIAQNGIQFGYGAKGNVMKNVVDGGNEYTGPNWTATGILVFESDNVNVHSNSVDRSQVGIAVETWCWIRQSASNNTIVKNEVTDATWGISVASYGFEPYSTCAAVADNNKITSNTVDGDAGVEGIFVGAVNFVGSFDPTADNNKVVNNVVTDFATPYSFAGDSATKYHANSPEL